MSAKSRFISWVLITIIMLLVFMAANLIMNRPITSWSREVEVQGETQWITTYYCDEVNDTIIGYSDVSRNEKGQWELLEIVDVNNVNCQRDIGSIYGHIIDHTNDLIVKLNTQ